MWLSQNWHHRSKAQFTPQRSPFIDRRFQLRYTLLLIGASALGVLLASIPTFYFINQNYEIFSDLAYQHAPDLLSHLEQERRWINTTLLAIFVGLFTLFTLLGHKMTARIVGPIKILQNHLHKVSRGYWFIRPIRIRDDDEFQDLIDSYNYFYASLRVEARDDLEKLKTIPIDPNNRDAYIAWRYMVNKKAAQLDLIKEGADPLALTWNAEGDAEPHEPSLAS
jgi:hypothetical protein